MNEKDKSLSYLNFLDRLLRGINQKNESSRNFNIGLFYGLIMGVIGNLAVSLIYDLELKTLSEGIKIWITIITLGIILFIIGICWYDESKFKKIDKKIENVLLDIEFEKDKIKNNLDYNLSEKQIFEKYMKNLNE